MESSPGPGHDAAGARAHALRRTVAAATASPSRGDARGGRERTPRELGRGRPTTRQGSRSAGQCPTHPR
eukprot:13669894-Alexandrium_andersonii.AAC.1